MLQIHIHIPGEPGNKATYYITSLVPRLPCSIYTFTFRGSLGTRLLTILLLLKV